MFVTALVLVAEMFNTAVETVVDMITQSYHPLAKLAKDIAAGGVLVAALTAAVVGSVLFFGNHGLGPIHRQAGSVQRLPMVLLSLLVVLVVIVLATKVLGGKGTILRGGIISGHAALAFVLAVSVIDRLGSDWISAVLVLMIALLVAQSRVEGKIHTLQEVVIGALVGICLTMGIFYFRIGR
jgi:diacylglycerol kinase (ATP)